MGKEKPPDSHVSGVPWGGEAFDYGQAAAQQGRDSQANMGQQTQENRPDQTNAYGTTSTWGVGPDGRPVQNSQFGGGLGTYASNLEGQLGTQGAFDQNAGNAARDQAITGAYGQATSRLDPQWAQREQQQKSDLAAQGLDPGSEAYQHTMGDFSRNRNDAYSSAMNGAIGQGTQAGSALFNQQVAAYQLPLQQLQGMSGLTGQAQFDKAGLAQIAPWLQAIMGFGQYGTDKAKAINAASGSFMSGLGGAAAAGAAAYGSSGSGGGGGGGE